MAKGFKFPAPKGFAKGGMCKPKGAKGYAKGGTIRGTNIQASDLYDDSDLESLEAGRNMPRETKTPMKSESADRARMMRKTMEEAAEYAKGGKVKHTDEAMDKALIKKMVKPGAMKKAAGGKVAMGKMKGSSKIVKAGYADGGEVETEQMASKATRVKMPRGAKAPMARAKAVPVAGRQPMIPPQGPAPSPLGAATRGPRGPMPGAGMPAPSPLSRVAAGAGAPRMGMKMGGKATKKH